MSGGSDPEAIAERERVGMASLAEWCSRCRRISAAISFHGYVKRGDLVKSRAITP